MNDWLQLGISILAPIVAALILLASTRVERAILDTVKEGKERNAILRLNDAVFDSVALVEQTLVQGLKTAPGEKLTAAKAAQARDAAVAEARKLLGPEGVAKLREVLGTGEDALDHVLVAKIERAVAALKQPPGATP